MSVTLKERRERAEDRIEALLGDMDETVRMVYESLLERGADYSELSEKQKVARLEGFHDYIIVREETGVDHPGLEEYIEVKKRRGDDLISFGTGKHRKPIEGEGPAPELAEEDTEPVRLITGARGKGHGFNRKLEMIAKMRESDAETSADEPVLDDRDEEDVTEETTEEATEEVTEEASPVTRSIFDDDDEEVVISSEPDEEETTGGFVARVPENKPEPDFEDLLHADKEEREEEKELIAKADEETKNDRISANDVVDKDFSVKMSGLDQEEVDDFLDEVAQFMAVPHDATVWLEQVKTISGKEFTKKGAFKKGYVPAEVKEFIEALKVELEIRASEA